MLKKLMRNKKAQNTAEYAILISLVVAGIIAMQTYAQRALQAKVRDAGAYLAAETRDMGTTKQYEPYYLETSYTVNRSENETQRLSDKKIEEQVNTTRTRAKGGFQESSFNAKLTGVLNGV